jgi:hypothetical protein
LKTLLIISPYFPPANAADMQRVRMSLTYFETFGWDVEVVTCHPQFYEVSIDELLLESIPENTKIHYVNAFSKKLTSKLGLGSLALRSLWFYRKKVNQLLKEKHFDLIYFSTTQFPVCILGTYWKRKFGIPYVIDMQDPWHSDYYQDKPKHQRPPKYWFSYRLNKYLEPIAMKNVDGLIAVSEQYNIDLKNRYGLNIPTATITFGAFGQDIKIARTNLEKYPATITKSKHITVGYIGRGGYDMQDAVKILFNAIQKGKEKLPDYFNQFHFNFLGTSYAPKGQGKKTIAPLAANFGLEASVCEQSDRLAFYQTINTLNAFDIFFICGSNDPNYTASKIYPYLLLEKPLLAIFHEKSSVVEILKSCSNATVITFQENKEIQTEKILDFFRYYNERKFELDKTKFQPYTAKEMTRKQCQFFDDIVK